MHYVALSRVRTLSGLFILQLCENKIHISNEVKQEMAVLRTDRMMHLSLHFPQSHDSIHITFLNVRALHQHIDLVRHDPILTASHINLFYSTIFLQFSLIFFYKVTVTTSYTRRTFTEFPIYRYSLQVRRYCGNRCFGLHKQVMCVVLCFVSEKSQELYESVTCYCACCG